MRSARRHSFNNTLLQRNVSSRLNGRVTKDDIRAAGLRRWDGRARITTDWLNVFHDPELCFPDGDTLIYLREPGQSSRGPAFRVHKAQLRDKGFEAILSKCIDRTPLPGTRSCAEQPCRGCDQHNPPSELYMPAPPRADLQTVFDHHITTRNFFAWLYGLPLTGRRLATSLITLKDRIDFYRPGHAVKTGLEIVSFAESLRYLDFRECIDHALAALALAESLKISDLWVDAFAHCVGLSHRGLQNSKEYSAIGEDTRLLIEKARIEMDIRTDRVDRSIEKFFEHELTSSSLGFSQAAKDHFERFRSWIHGFYIEQHGFWPPVGFSDSMKRRAIYASMYSDLRNLYHHLADAKSSASTGDVSLSASGGVCIRQSIQAFNQRHKYDPLPHPLPMLPDEPSQASPFLGLQRRKSWNPVTKRRVERDTKKALRVQALVSSSNRDWSIMACLLVRRYSEFEAHTVLDETEDVSMVEGRKIRWILVYTVLQTLISVMQAPTEVRNTDGVSYALCCHVPSAMPWEMDDLPTPPIEDLSGHSLIVPDIDHLQSQNQSNNNSPENSNNSSAVDLLTLRLTKQLSKKDKNRRQTLPARMSRTLSAKSAPSSRSNSLRRFMPRRNSDVPETPTLPRAGAFCEIRVPGYGNGLNEVDHCVSPTEATFIGHVDDVRGGSHQGTAADDDTPRASRSMSPALVHGGSTSTVTDASLPKGGEKAKAGDDVPDLVTTSSASVSRESSNASTNSTWSKSSCNSQPDEDKGVDVGARTIPPRTMPQTIPLPARSKARPNSTSACPTEVTLEAEDRGHNRIESKDFNKILDEQGLYQTVHINTQAWDNYLAMP